MHIAAWWAQLWPNLAASALWAGPGFTAHHLLMRRHVQQATDRQTQQLKAHLDQTGAAR